MTKNIFAQTVIIRNEFPRSNNILSGVNPNTGNLQNLFPINIPDGIGGIQPGLTISYANNKQNSIIGVGWSFPFNNIARSTKRGVPSYGSTDQFILNHSGGSQELVFDAAQSIYREEVEGNFSKIEFSSNVWTITDRQGTKFTFGGTSDSKQFDTAAPNNVFKWYLNKVEDIQGNQMIVTYQKDNNQIYPYLINYTSNPSVSLSAFAEVEFQRENRLINYSSYESGFLIKTTKRISKIIVRADGVMQREYVLAYDQSQSTQRDLLASITQKGNDGSSLPPTTFQYYEDEKGVELLSGSGAGIPSGVNFISSGRDQGVRIIDVNSDGYPDIVKNFFTYNGINNTQQKIDDIYLNNKSGGWSLASGLEIPGHCTAILCSAFAIEVTENSISNGQVVVITNSIDFGFRATDVDGDGKLDFVHGQIEYLLQNGSVVSNVSRFKTYLNQLPGWGTDQTTWHVPSDALFQYWFGFANQSGGSVTFGLRRESLGNLFVDVNNDGYTDIITSRTRTTSSDINAAITTLRKTYINNLKNGSTGWTNNTTWTPPNSTNADFWNGATLVDLNGDNLPEIFYRKSGTTVVYMNTGNGWTLDASSPWNSTLGDISDGSTQFGDINGDGLDDMIIAKGSFSNGSRTLINTGNGWIQDDAWVVTEANFVNLGARLLDYNADTMLEVLVMDGSTPHLYTNTGKPADLLYQIDNSLGGLTDVEWGTSAESTNTFLPFSFPVVKKIIKSNGLGDSYQTTFAYANGMWSAADREFRGFGFTKVTQQESDYVESDIIVNDEFKKGRVSESRVYTASAGLLNKVTNLWDVQQIVTGSKFVFLKERNQYSYDSGSTTNGKRSKEEFLYAESPQYGNLTKYTHFGEVNFTTGADITGDTRVVDTAYLNNTSLSLLGLPKETIVTGYDGQPIRKTWFFYDNHNTDISAQPTGGLLTKVENWNNQAQGNSANPAVVYTYNSLGNRLTAVSPEGHTEQIIYDGEFGIFPVQVQNQVGSTTLIEEKEYYGVDGVLLDSGDGYAGLWGQLKSTIDPNSNKEQFSYDTFGRLTETVSPLDTITLPTASMEYDLTSTYTAVTTRQRMKSGEAPTLDSVEFRDGLGRALQVKSEAADSSHFIVSGQNKYNSKGQPVEQYLPYFSPSTTPIDTPDAINSSLPHTTISYDPLGRVLQTVTPSADQTTHEYSAWTVKAIDGNSHKTESDLDAYGRLKTKREYLGISPTYSLYATTAYEYNSESNLTKVADADPAGPNLTLITYDKLGRKTQLNDPDMGVWSYEYDKNGNLTKQTDAKGQILRFEYDGINRLKRKYNDPSGSLLDVTYVYDNTSVNRNSLGRLSEVQFGSGLKTEFFYDKLGRGIKTIRTIETIPFVTEQSFDALDNVEEIIYPNDEHIYYDYNDAGQMKAISNDPALFNQSLLIDGRKDREQYAMVTSDKSHDTRHRSQDRIMGDGSRITFLGKIAVVFEEYVLGVKPAYAQTSEDFNSFIEEDPQVKITRTTDCVSFVNIESNNSASYVYKTRTTSGDFVYEFDTILTAGDSLSKETAVWGISNTGADTYDQWSGGAFFGWFKNGSTVRLELETKSPLGSDNSVTLSLNQRYYVRVSRSGTALTAQIYSDAQRTTLVDTLTRPFNNTSFANLYGFSNDAGIATGQKMSGDVCHLVENPQGGGDTQAPSVPQNVNFSNPTSSSLQLNWAHSNDNVQVTGYRIDVATNSSFTNMVTGYNNKDVTYVNTTPVTGLNPSTPYYARVRAYDAATNTSTNSSTANETTSAASDTQAPSVPQNVNFSNPTSSSLQLNWTASTDNVGVTGYRIDVSTSSTFATFVTGYNNKDVFNVTSTSVTGLNPSTAYYARVRAYDAVPNTSTHSSTANGTTSAAGGGGSLGNFSSFTVVDPQTKIIKTADCVSFTDIETQNSASFVYKVFTTSGDFTYEFDTILTASDFTSGETAVWGISNDLNTYDLWSDGAFLSWYKSGSTTIRLELETKSPNGSDNSVNLSLNQRYYVRVSRAGTSLTAQIYSDAQRTTLVDTLTRAFNTAAFDNIYGFSNDTWTVTGHKASGDVCHLSDGNAIESMLFVQDMAYNAAGFLTAVEYGNGVVTDYTYNADLRLAAMVTKDATDADIQDLSYAYDDAGNVLEITDGIASQSKEFTYDELDRLKTAAGNYGASQSFTTLNYAYDKIGNLTSKEGVTLTYGAGPAGPHAITGAGSDTFTYDLNGNMLQHVGGGITRNFEYDIENRLKTYKHGTSTIATYAYDYSGQRIKKTVSQSGITTRFAGALYEEDNTGAEYQHVFAGGTRVATIAPLGVKFYHGDHLGSRSVVTDVDGLEVDHIDYKPFGEINRHDAVASEEGHHFTDQYRDDETDLYYYGARYYNPKVGRFIQPDSIIPGEDNPQAFNRYSYVFNNPVNAIDPSGNKPSVPNAYSSYYDFDESFSNFGSSIASYDLVGIQATLSQSSQSTNSLSSFNFSGADLFALIQQNNSFQQNSFSELQPLSDGRLQFSNSVLQGHPFARITPDVQGEVTEAINPAIFLIGGIQNSSTSAPKAIAGKITGYTKHAVEQAIGREGRGVSIKAMLDAVRNPIKTVPQIDKSIKYIGDKATVVLNEAGKIITTWGKPRVR